MTSAPSRGETDDQSLSLRSATVLQLQTFRVICQPQAVEQGFIHWSISPVEVQKTSEEIPPVYALVGDLAIGAEEWFVGATASIVFAVAQRYGPWAARVLWDHVSAAARTVSALCHGSASLIDIPGTMPDVAYPSMAEQADRATNDE